VDAEDDALVAGGAVALSFVEAGIGVFAAVDVVEGTEEELPLARTLQVQLVAGRA